MFAVLMQYIVPDFILKTVFTFDLQFIAKQYMDVVENH